ncbi:MAG TPA: helical backbone metal receptor [Syntrophobacter fumaroxidans]|nr:helical backbone metal receptor [Syntrophobacter fumaroxidans]
MKPFRWILAFLLVVSILHTRAGAVQITDDLGTTVTLSQPAARIISLYGAFAEMLYAVGAGSRLAARTQADAYPPEILKLPSVGTHMKPNFEMIIGFKPDLVIQSASRREEMPDMERLSGVGIPVAVFAPKSFEDIFSTMERLGVITGCEGEAGAAVARMKQRLARVQAKLAGIEKRRRVFFEIRAEPLTGAGRGSIVQRILAAAGAENVLRSEKAIVQYSLEALLLDDPDVYVMQRGPMNRNPAELAARAHFDRLRCVKEGKIVPVDEFIFSRPGPRCVEAVEQLAAALYPTRFDEGGR